MPLFPHPFIRESVQRHRERNSAERALRCVLLPRVLPYPSPRFVSFRFVRIHEDTTHWRSNFIAIDESSRHCARSPPNLIYRATRPSQGEIDRFSCVAGAPSTICLVSGLLILRIFSVLPLRERESFCSRLTVHGQQRFIATRFVLKDLCHLFIEFSREIRHQKENKKFSLNIFKKYPIRCIYFIP